MSTIPRFYVYILVRPNGKVFYVGKGTKRRVWRHDDEARRGCECRKCRTIRKVWREGGEIQRYIVLTTDDEQEALQYEREMIALHGRENLCNHTDGGEGPSGHIASPQTRAKMSAAQKIAQARPEVREKRRQRMLGHTVSDDTRAKLSARHKGRKGTRLGMSNSPEHRRKIGEAHRGRKKKPESIEKMRRTLTGKKINLSDEARQQRSERMMGNKYGTGNPNIWTKGKELPADVRRKISETLKEKAPWRGKRHTEESIQKMRETQSARSDLKAKNYECQEPDGTIYTIRNLVRFCKERGLPYDGVQRAIRTNKTYKGWRFMRLE